MNWPSVPIREHALEVRSWNPQREAKGTAIQYIDLSSVDNEAKNIRSIQTVSADDAPSRARQLVKGGDILISTVRPNLNGIARVPKSMDGATASTGFCIIRLDPESVSPEYFFQWFKSAQFVANMVKLATGASYPAVSDRIVLDSTIPLPPLDEQRRIAAILDQADVLRRKRQTAVARIAALRRAVFTHLFGDLNANPKGWPIYPFSELCTNEDGLRVPVRSADRAEKKGKYPYYGASGIIDHVDEYIFDGERLLIGEDGANLLARSTPVAFIASGKYWVNNHAHVLSENGRAELEFLEYFLNSIDLKPYISGSAQPKLNQANLNRIPVPCPPLTAQKTFVRFANVANQILALQRNSSERLSSLFDVLQLRAFSGEA